MTNSKIRSQNSPTLEYRLLSDACKKLDSPSTHQDRISKLPDEILTHILSFLPTESAVATSALSMRWYYLWTLVPNLDFSSNDLKISSASLPMIAKFVDRVLFINNVSSVRKIHLHCSHYWEDSLVIDWINAVVKREAEVFDLRVPSSFVNDDDIYELYAVPDSFFNQNNLVHLKLENMCLEVPSYVCFPRLEKIAFKSVHFVDKEDDAMKTLLSNCPVLKSLCLKRRRLIDGETLSICSTTLQDLELYDLSYDLEEKYGYHYVADTPNQEDFGCKVVIDTPNLKCINLTDKSCTNFDIVDVSSLVKASLRLLMHGGESSHVYEERLRAVFVLPKFSRVKELILKTSSIIDPLYDSLGPVGFFPVFTYLTHLDVDIAAGWWWLYLPHLLHCMPNVVDLVMNVEVVDDEFDEDMVYEPHELLQSLLSGPENIKIVFVDECHMEMKLIKYILKHGIVLKKLSIQTACLQLSEVGNIVEKLRTAQKGANSCQIEFKNMARSGKGIISLYHIRGDELVMQ